MKTSTGFYSGILLLFVSLNSYAQDDTIPEKISHFRISAYYNSRINYYGRTDSLNSSAVLPAAEIWMNKNFYISAMPVFINNRIQQLEYSGTVATAGYQFTHENKIAGHIYVVKPFYREGADLVQSALKAQAAVNITWLTGLLNFTGGADVKFSDKQDPGLTAGIDHALRIQLPHSVFVLDPSVYMFAGTQRFTQTYLSKKEGFLLFPERQEIISKQTQKFSIIAYEISVPVIFNFRNRVQLFLTPAYITPKNDPIAKDGVAYVTTGMKILL